MYGIIAICLFVTLLIVCMLCAYFIEKKQFNKGICPKCGNRLRYFDTDSHGGRGFTCNNCNYTVWVSWFDPLNK